MSVILNPIISEKSMSQVGRNRFTFRVLKDADKGSIKKEIEERFKVNIVDIATILTKGRSVSVRTRTRASQVSKEPFKKAIVTLKEGQKIPLFDTGGTK